MESLEYSALELLLLRCEVISPGTHSELNCNRHELIFMEEQFCVSFCVTFVVSMLTFLEYCASECLLLRAGLLVVIHDMQ